MEEIDQQERGLTGPDHRPSQLLYKETLCADPKVEKSIRDQTLGKDRPKPGFANAHLKAANKQAESRGRQRTRQIRLSSWCSPTVYLVASHQEKSQMAKQCNEFRERMRLEGSLSEFVQVQYTFFGRLCL